MKIPLYVKVPMKNSLESSGQTKVLSGKQDGHKNGSVCEVENEIEIRFIPSHAQLYIVPLVLLSWLPMIFILFYLHSSVTNQIENQREQIIAYLESEVSSLNSELLSLKIRVDAMEEVHKTKWNNVGIERGQPLLIQELSSPVVRQKRGVNDGMSNNFKEGAPSERKEPSISATRRGKQMSSRKHKRLQAQHRRQCQRLLSSNNTKCGAFQAIHLKGAHPETVVETGHVGPWFIDTKAVKDSALSSSFQLKENGESIEVNSPGLYFIYAQVYYLTSHSLNSFTIKLTPKDSDNPTTLAYCSSSTVSSSLTSEVSCFTSTMHTLQAGDRIYIQQREKHRRLIMRPGHSYLGLMKFTAQ